MFYTGGSPPRHLQTLAITHLFSIPEALHKRDHTVCNLLGSASFIQLNYLEIHPGCRVYEEFIPFTAEERSVVRMCHFVNHSPAEGNLSCYE